MAITFEKVNFSYGAGTTLAQAILHDVTVTMPTGQVTAIVGQTGSGKSTLVQHINGLLKPTAGRVLVDGFELTPRTKEKQLMPLRPKWGWSSNSRKTSCLLAPYWPMSCMHR